MPVDLNHRKIGNNEIKVYSICLKSFKKQKKFLMDNLSTLYNKYVYNISIAYTYLDNVLNLYPKKFREDEFSEEPLGGFWREMGVYDMIEACRDQIQKTTNKGYQRRVRLFQPIIEKTGIEINQRLADEYADQRVNLELSNFKGTITHTTKYDVIKILKEGLDNNLTYTEVAEQINKLSDRLFSPARAQTIAVTEIGKAYEYGNYQPIKQLSEAGVPIKKYWLTCRDAKVREEHRECEDLGWVDVNLIYPSTGTAIPPGGVNCRCTMEYDFEL